mmetsp:Transcript_2300/g.8225  ORF Transcript_2300/g.8225 Transcript_2300/m.8225 type:complete len:297 (+) Transcript_2300:1519-2409(+)
MRNCTRIVRRKSTSRSCKRMSRRDVKYLMAYVRCAAARLPAAATPSSSSAPATLGRDRLSVCDSKADSDSSEVATNSLHLSSLEVTSGGLLKYCCSDQKLRWNFASSTESAASRLSSPSPASSTLVTFSLLKRPLTFSAERSASGYRCARKVSTRPQKTVWLLFDSRRSSSLHVRSTTNLPLLKNAGCPNTGVLPSSHFHTFSHSTMLHESTRSSTRTKKHGFSTCPCSQTSSVTSSSAKMTLAGLPPAVSASFACAPPPYTSSTYSSSSWRSAASKSDLLSRCGFASESTACCCC